MTAQDTHRPPSEPDLRTSAAAALRDLARASRTDLGLESALPPEELTSARAILGWMAEVLDGTRKCAEWVDGDVHAAARVVRSGTPLLLGLDGDTGPESGASWVVIHEGDDDELCFTTHGPGDERHAYEGSATDFARICGIADGESRRWLLVAAAASAAPGKHASAGPGSDASPLRRLYRILRPDRGDLLAIALYAVASGLLLLATPIAVQALVSFVALGGALTPLVVVTALLFLGLLFAGVVAAIQTWLVEILQRRLFARTVADLAARLPRVRLAVFDERNGPELVNRFFDVMTMQKAGAALLLDGLGIALTIIVGLVLLAFYHPLLLAFDVLLLLCIAGIVMGPVRRGVRTAIGESYAKYAVVDWLQQLTRHPHLFRSGGLHAWIAKRSDAAVQHYLDSRRQHFRVLFAQIGGALALHVVASTALLGLGGLLVMRGGLTLGQLVAAELIVTLIVASVAKMGKQLENYYDLMAATDKVAYLLDLPLERFDGAHQIDTVGSEGMELDVRGLSATRGNSPPLFGDLSFQVAAGERLVLRGASGVGKSTLLELLWGLRNPRSGTIRVDDHELGALSLDAYRASAALATEVDIVSASVRDNVRLGRTFVSELDVRLALDRVGLTAAVDRLREGIATPLNSRGWPLSENEVRALQVARILADPPRLVLVSEEVLPEGGALRQQALDSLLDPTSPWTVVIASNAPDVLERCYRALELPSGDVQSLGRGADPDPSSSRDPAA